MSVKFLDRSPLLEKLSQYRLDSLADVVGRVCHQRFQPEHHGMLDTWHDAWNALPDVEAEVELNSDAVRVLVGKEEATSDIACSNLRSTLMRLHPWRKGPFEFLGIPIDSEWRSHLKWDRFADKIDLARKRVLDVGCGNGYYGWRMVGRGADFVLGCEPFLLSVVQFEAFRKYWPAQERLFVAPLADNDLPRDLGWFDWTFSMGVLYHRPNPIEHLQILASTLRPRGQLLLETLVLESSGCDVLVPEDRYAKMRNVWFIPTVPMLERWLRRTGFKNIQILDVTRTTADEQRITSWMTFESLSDFLSPDDPTRTIEGYPAPVRAILTAEK